MPTTPEYTQLPERVAQALQGPPPPEDKTEAQVARFADVKPRPADEDGATEVFGGVVFTHRHVDAPGDEETVHWHYVEAGPADGETIVFLHGLPASWFQWQRQMAAMAATHRCLAVDLKGYGQSEKGAGDYRHEAAAEQMMAMLRQVGVLRFNLVAHDRGTVQADYIAANFPDTVLRYARGEQHLYHLNPALMPQEKVFRDAPWTGVMEDPHRFVVQAYMSAAKLPIADDELSRLIQEFSYPGVARAVPRYFNSSTFRQEWLARRHRLLAAWRCPVLILQGHDSDRSPREFYEGSREYIPNASEVQVRYIPGGHFWTSESPQETTEAVRFLLKLPTS